MPNDTRKLSAETSSRPSRTGGRAATTGVIPGRFALSVGILICHRRIDGGGNC